MNGGMFVRLVAMLLVLSVPSVAKAEETTTTSTVSWRVEKGDGAPYLAASVKIPCTGHERTLHFIRSVGGERVGMRVEIPYYPRHRYTTEKGQARIDGHTVEFRLSPSGHVFETVEFWQAIVDSRETGLTFEYVTCSVSPNAKRGIAKVLAWNGGAR